MPSVKPRGVVMTPQLEKEVNAYLEANPQPFNQLVKAALKSYLYQQKVKAEPTPKVAQPQKDNVPTLGA